LADNPLATLTPDQLTALLDTLRKQVQPTKPRVSEQHPTIDDRQYYHVTRGLFECVVDPRDVRDESPEAIQEAALSPLQAWYHSGRLTTEFGYTLWTHKQYVDWLRR
jgi:hypothetical protein